MPVGIYKRKKYKVTCECCNDVFIVKQVKTHKCSSCQKKINDKKYRDKNMKQLSLKHSLDPRKKMWNKISYQRNKVSRSLKAKETYLKNRDKIIKRAEHYRRKLGIKKRGLSGVETKFLKLLKERYPDKEISVNNRTIIKSPLTGRYLELDYYFINEMVAIELNGVSHYKNVHGEEKYQRQIRNDKIKKEVCKKLGIKLICIKLDRKVNYCRHTDKLKELMMQFVRLREDKPIVDCIWRN